MNTEILIQLHNNKNSMQLQRDFLRNEGKKGFRFCNNPDNYLALVTKYNEKIKPTTSDTDQFAILYTLLDDEADTIYNRHLAETDKTET